MEGHLWNQSNAFDFGYVEFEMPVIRCKQKSLWAIRKINKFKREVDAGYLSCDSCNNENG